MFDPLTSELQLRGMSPISLACSASNQKTSNKPAWGFCCNVNNAGTLDAGERCSPSTVTLSLLARLGGEVRCMGRSGVGWRGPGVGTAPQPGLTARLGAEAVSSTPTV